MDDHPAILCRACGDPVRSANGPYHAVCSPDVVDRIRGGEVRAARAERERDAALAEFARLRRLLALTVIDGRLHGLAERAFPGATMDAIAKIARGET